MFHFSATVDFLVEVLISSEMAEGRVRQRKEEEKIRLKSEDFIIIMCDLRFSHCIFLDLNEINMGGGGGGGRERERKNIRVSPTS